ncbi:MAG: hypothetical protein WAV85_04190 [Rhodoferax sp.]
MTSFALITEGITDQAILENLLSGLTDGKAVTRALRPLRDETDNSRVAKDEFSNWELVLEFVKSDQILDAIQTNDFVVIQIDTDQCEHINFGISLMENGKNKSIDKIVRECVMKIQGLLHPDFPEDERSRLLFAIPVLSSECWLISIHDKTHKHTRKTSNSCDLRLRTALTKKRLSFKKEYENYLKISNDFRKIKLLKLSSENSICLKIFIDNATKKIKALGL